MHLFFKISRPSIGELARYCGKHENEFETISTPEELHVNFVSDGDMTRNEGFIVTFTDRQGNDYFQCAYFLVHDSVSKLYLYSVTLVVTHILNIFHGIYNICRVKFSGE